jgi:two-component system OmpR family sensor kinase
MNRSIKTHQKHLLLGILFFCLGVVLFLALLYLYLEHNGFSRQTFLEASVAVVFLAIVWGYFLSVSLLASKQRMDTRFSHLSKEILHELNIPLATMEANITMLRRTLADEKSKRRLERVDGATHRLKRLYQELVYAINKELHLVQREDFSLLALLRERVDALHLLGRNPMALEVDDLTLRADKIGFEQMIDNLLNNAMKYSDKQSPISISTDRHKLLIVDHGIGMDESQLVQIFERYYQADHRHEGEGIGLALVKRYCDAEGIDIVIRSKVAEGTTVELILDRLLV